MGTPAFAAPALAALPAAGHETALVVTQPDRPAGRGRHLTPPPVKAKAIELGLPLFQPARVREPEVLRRLEQQAPDVIVVVGYGQLIPQSIIDLPRFGCVNVHASLLPKYRGAAPIQWAIANGESRTGITTMQIEKRLDAGDILLQHETGIGPEETASELAARLAPMGAELLVETLQGLQSGTVVPKKQDEDQATYAPILKREDGLISWTLPAAEIANRIRAFDPWPGGYTAFREKRLQLRKVRVGEPFRAKPGTISLAGGRLRVCCGEGSALLVEEVQLEGKNRVGAEEFARGYHLKENETLGESEE